MPRLRVVIPALAAALLALSGCGTGAPPAPTTWPTSIVVLGHSGATGYDSDPARPEQDAVDNSWATGGNPDVDSVYLRALAQSPALQGHNFNVARSGSDVTDLPRQVEAALELDPLPDLFIIQSVDNDQACNDSDQANLPVYGQRITAVLQSIVDGAPDAKIYVIGTPVTWQNYTDALAGVPGMVQANTGDGPCDVFDAAGQVRPEALAYGQASSDAYGEQLRAACAGFPACTFGGDEMRDLEVVTADIAPDGSHFGISGLQKMAAIAWEQIKDLGD
jgi:hypothetical protein